MRAQLVMCGVVEALDRCLLDGAVHPLDLAIRPRMPRLGQPVLDVEAGAAQLRRMAAAGHRLGRPRPAAAIERHRKGPFSAPMALMSSGVQPSPVGSVKCVPLSVSPVLIL